DRQVPRMPDTSHHDVVDPLVRVLAALAGEDSDRRPAGALRPARRSGHHLAEAAGDDRAAPLGEQPTDLLGPLLVLAAAADDGDLDRHGCDANWHGCGGTRRNAHP